MRKLCYEWTSIKRSLRGDASLVFWKVSKVLDALHRRVVRSREKRMGKTEQVRYDSNDLSDDEELV